MQPLSPGRIRCREPSRSRLVGGRPGETGVRPFLPPPARRHDNRSAPTGRQPRVSRQSNTPAPTGRPYPPAKIRTEGRVPGKPARTQPQRGDLKPARGGSPGVSRQSNAPAPTARPYPPAKIRTEGRVPGKPARTQPQRGDLKPARGGSPGVSRQSNAPAPTGRPYPPCERARSGAQHAARGTRDHLRHVAGLPPSPRFLQTRRHATFSLPSPFFSGTPSLDSPPTLSSTWPPSRATTPWPAASTSRSRSAW